MTDQLRIGDGGQIEAQPLTWDREPLWSADTVREGLFDRSAFEQLPGQLAITAEDESATLVRVCSLCWQRVPEGTVHCPHCDGIDPCVVYVEKRP